MATPIPSCFKAYDIRGKVPEELNNDLAHAIGCGLVEIFGLQKVVIGRDVRLSGPEILEQCAAGMQQQGCDVLDIGLCGTEEMYHAVFSNEDQGVDGGIIVTASHNPSEYNGMKIVLKGARPLSGDTGLTTLGKYAASPPPQKSVQSFGSITRVSYRKTFIAHLLGSIKPDGLAPLKIVTNSGNGCAGPVLDELEKQLPFTLVKYNHQPDGTFPHGVPNPLLQENRRQTAQAVLQHGADMGLAWDGDFDRCFFWDEKGRFIEGYYVVGLLARELLTQNPGEKILHDPRLVWNTVELVKENGGVPVMTKTGHAFIKERMRAENALYGGEMSAHHYFRGFGYCDSGMLPWLLVAALLGREEKPLSAFVDTMIDAYPVSGELNTTVADADAVIKNIEQMYSDGEKDYTDGLSVSFAEYRFNIRKSNTEPLLRLNVESRGDRALMEEKTRELVKRIQS
ncbi:MAG: phosphomannomutase [Desulfopila sp.]